MCWCVKIVDLERAIFSETKPSENMLSFKHQPTKNNRKADGDSHLFNAYFSSLQNSRIKQEPGYLNQRSLN